MPKTKQTDTDITSTTDDMEALRAELAELKAGKAHAEAEARNAKKEARDAKFQTMSAQERAVAAEQEACDSRIAEAEAEAQSLEDQIAALADEPGHGREIAQLTRKLTSVSTKIDSETNRKAFLAQQREKVTTTNKTARETATVEDGGKVLANGMPIGTFGPKTQAWLEAHPKAFTDVRYIKKAIHAATEALEIEGLTDESPEYFAFVEGKLGEQKAAPVIESDEDEDEGEEVDPPEVSYTPEKPQQRAAGPGALAAPVTRQVPQGGGGGNRRAPTLSAEEREVADSLYASLPNPADRYVKYATNKKIMNTRNNQHFRGAN